MHQMKSEVRDGMQIDWDAPIKMDDGLVLRADVFRPLGDGKYPVLLSYGPYAKGLAFQEGYKSAWTRLIKAATEVLEVPSGKWLEFGVARSPITRGYRFRLRGQSADRWAWWRGSASRRPCAC